MGRHPSLSSDNRTIALELLEAGVRVADAARRFGVHERTVFRLQARFQVTGSVKDRPRSGRPHKTTPREDRYIVTSSLHGRPKACG